jgi:L-seryl-tRNA(Ser) seleniumtransferase
VLNATGVVLHTNLGRAPLAPAAAESARDAALGYANLELDLETGRRGARDAHVRALVTELTGAEDALAVNNGAAAALLAAAALAGPGGTIVVSRGQLVEIGGGFRVPRSSRRRARASWRSAPRTGRASATTRPRCAPRPTRC